MNNYWYVLRVYMAVRTHVGDIGKDESALWGRAWMFTLKQLTRVEVAIFTSAGRFDVLVVDDDESHFVSLIVDIVDGQIGFGDCVCLRGLPRVSRVVSVLHTYSCYSVTSALCYNLNNIYMSSTFV